MSFYIDKNIENAHFIDKHFYLDSLIYKDSINKVFRKNPIYLGHHSTFDFQSLLQPKSIYPKLLDEEIILHFEGSKLNKILSNVCTHRAHLLLNQKSNNYTIQCPYHGRTFNCQGEIKNAPGFEDKLEYLRQNEQLTQYSYFNFGGFYFLNEQNLKVDNLLGDFPKIMDWFPFSKLVTDNNFSKEFEIDAHWALYVENYLEGFHIPFIHKGLAKEIKLNDYKIEILPKATLQLATGKHDDSTFSKFKNVPEKYGNLAAIYLWIYPNIMINIYAWGISVNVIIPQSKEKTIIRYQTFVLNPDDQKLGAGGNLGTVEMEDQQAILMVQKGLKSSAYKPGKISSIHEQGVHHFHQLLIEDLNN